MLMSLSSNPQQEFRQKILKSKEKPVVLALQLHAEDGSSVSGFAADFYVTLHNHPGASVAIANRDVASSLPLSVPHTNF